MLGEYPAARAGDVGDAYLVDGPLKTEIRERRVPWSRGSIYAEPQRRISFETSPGIHGFVPGIGPVLVGADVSPGPRPHDVVPLAVRDIGCPGSHAFVTVIAGPDRATWLSLIRIKIPPGSSATVQK